MSNLLIEYRSNKTAHEDIHFHLGEYSCIADSYYLANDIMNRKKQYIFAVGMVIVVFMLPRLKSLYVHWRMVGDLQQHRNLWSEQKLVNYNYALDIVCECGSNTNTPIIVQVRNGKRVSPLRRSTWRIPDPFDAYDTVEKLFQVTQDAIESNVDSVIIKYDATLGYPTQISIDENTETVDDEIGIGASKLHAAR